MVRKLEGPLQSPRRSLFKPTPLSPKVIVEEESDLLSPSTKEAGGAVAGISSDGNEKAKVSGTKFQVTTV